jgi:hypothetical protein
MQTALSLSLSLSLSILFYSIPATLATTLFYIRRLRRIVLFCVLQDTRRISAK